MKLNGKRLAIALSLILTVGLMAAPASAAKKEAGSRPQYVFGAGSPGGTYEMVATGIAKVLNKYASFELLPTTFTSLNMGPAALNDGEVMMSIASISIFERGFKGIGNFEGHASPNIRQVMAIYDNIVGLLARGDSKAMALEDVTNDTIFAVTPGNFQVLSNYLRALGETGIIKADPEALIKKARRMTYAQIWDQLADGNVEIAYVTGSPYNGGADSVIGTKKARFLNVSKDPAKVEAFKEHWRKLYPDTMMLAIPKGTYATTTEDVWGPTDFTAIYASKDAPDSLITEFIELTLRHMKEIALVHPAGGQISLEANKRNIADGVMQIERMHPAAVAYFKKVGAIK